MILLKTPCLHSYLNPSLSHHIADFYLFSIFLSDEMYDTGWKIVVALTISAECVQLSYDTVLAAVLFYFFVLILSVNSFITAVKLDIAIHSSAEITWCLFFTTNKSQSVLT